MTVTFDLNGKEKIIRVSGTSSFTAVDDKDKPLGHYSSLSGAVLKHIKEESIRNKGDNEEVISLKDYVKRLDSLCEQVINQDFNSKVNKKEKSKSNKEEDDSTYDEF